MQKQYMKSLQKQLILCQVNEQVLIINHKSNTVGDEFYIFTKRQRFSFHKKIFKK